MSPERVVNIVVMAAVFGLVFSVWCICILLWLGRYLARLQIVQRRLGVVAKETDESRTLRLWREAYIHPESVILPKKAVLRERLERLRQDAGWDTPIETVMVGVIGIAGLAFVVMYLLTGAVLLGLGTSAAIVVLFWTYMRRHISKHTALFERQLVDALGVAARALRAGHPLVGAFQLVSGEIAEPLGPIFSQIWQEQALGLDLKDSIRKVAGKTNNAEFRLFATAVAIQLKSGGNLADLMDSLASVIRARMRLNRRVRILTAQTQFSKKILIVIPILLFFAMNLINPEYMEPFYITFAGRLMLVGAILCILFGSWVMSRISKLRF